MIAPAVWITQRVFPRGFFIEVFGVVRIVGTIESDFPAAAVIKERVVIIRKTLEGKTFCRRPPPDDFALKIIFAENLVEHDFDVVAGVPVAVVIKAAGLFEDTGQFHAAGAHEIHVGLGAGVAVVKGALLAGLTPKDLVVPVRIEWRVNVNEVNAGVGQFEELLQIVAAIDDSRVRQRGGFHPGGRRRWHVRFLRHKRSLGKRREKGSLLAAANMDYVSTVDNG